MKNKILLLFLSLVLCISLAGCNTAVLSVDQLMHPPKAVGEKADIQNLIDSVAGEDYTLKYPQSGSYRSAITMKDIDSDSIEEAVAFYLPSGDIAKVHILIMDNIDGKWQAVGNFKSQSTSVDSLTFCDLDGNGIMEIVSCFRTYNPTINQVSAYICENNTCREITSAFNCTNLLCGNFDSEPGDELLLLSLFSTENEASASLLTLNDNASELTALGTTALNPDVVSFSQLLTGNIFEGQFGAVVDGCTIDGEYTTQLLYFNSYYDSLERIYFTENVAYNQKLRTYPVMSKDIDGDSVIEVPAAFKLGLEKDRTDVVAAAEIYWCHQTPDGAVMLASHQAASFAYSFTFEIPKEWEGNFTAHTNYDSSEVTFYTWQKNATGDALLTIKIFEKESDEDYSGYTVLAETDSRLYTYSIPESNSQLLLSDNEIVDAFSLM